jgi:hypothetical protein
MRTLLADLILVAHVAIAGFIVGALLLTWLGAWRGWRWVRDPWFRWGHLAAICFVALQALAGRLCPLTIWEDQLRGVASERGFIERHLAPLLYWPLPPWAFTAIYVAFALAVAATLWWLPPLRHAGRSGDAPGVTRSP